MALHDIQATHGMGSQSITQALAVALHGMHVLSRLLSTTWPCTQWRSMCMHRAAAACQQHVAEALLGGMLSLDSSTKNSWFLLQSGSLME